MTHNSLLSLLTLPIGLRSRNLLPAPGLYEPTILTNAYPFALA